MARRSSGMSAGSDDSQATEALIPAAHAPGPAPRTAAAPAPRQPPPGSVTVQQARLTREEWEEQERLKELKYGADAILSLILPVSLCMVVVVATIKSVNYYTESNGQQLPYTPMREEEANSTGEQIGFALINVLIVICVVICLTMVLVMLYKYRCYMAIHIWLLIVSFMLLFFISGLYAYNIQYTHNVTIDWITFCFILWNWGVAGIMAIHWKGPLRLQQMYNIILSSLIALLLIKYLPDWTCWMLLGGIAIYDLFAVLCPGGPLRQLLETAQEREEPIFPALIYSSGMLWSITMADTGQRDVKVFAPEPGESSTDAEPTATAQPQSELQRPAAEPTVRETDTRRPVELDDEDDDEDAGGVKLGLGDFIFYSVLVGKAASQEWSTIFSCYVGIVVGLVCTLFILSVYQKALPALPISILFGIVFYFSTSQMITPCLYQTAIQAAFV